MSRITVTLYYIQNDLWITSAILTNLQNKTKSLIILDTKHNSSYR